MTATFPAPGPFARARLAEAAGPADKAAISVRGLWKIFGPGEHRIIGTALAELSRAELRSATGSNIAVRDVTFDVRPGEVFVVMGLSGSGKSTLIRCLTRLIEPTAGEVILDGEDIGKASQSRLRTRSARAWPPRPRRRLRSGAPSPGPRGCQDNLGER